MVLRLSLSRSIFLNSSIAIIAVITLAYSEQANALSLIEQCINYLTGIPLFTDSPEIRSKGFI